MMDIALSPQWRGRGLGSTLLDALLAEAQVAHCQVTLHVEPGNPARQWYARRGFTLIEDRGVYLFLGWESAAADQLNTIS